MCNKDIFNVILQIIMLQPRSKWGDFKAEIAELAKEIIEQEVYSGNVLFCANDSYNYLF